MLYGMVLILFTLKMHVKHLERSMDCYFAPLVDLSFHYKKPIKYGMTPRIDIIYRPTEAAKIVFDYEIHDVEDDSLIATGHSVQVFMDLNYQLVWDNPPFYQQWKERWEQVDKKS